MINVLKILPNHETILEKLILSFAILFKSTILRVEEEK